jgi:3-hydroxybutyryl-CoA dehydratase
MNEYRWSDLHIGLSHSFDAVVTAEMMKRFEQDTGDINPLHVDRAFATGRGFPDVVVFGLLTSSFYSTLVGVHLPGKFALLQGLNIDFHKPVFVGLPLRVSGEIVHLTDAYRQATISAHIRTHDGERLSKASIRVGVHE